MEESDGGHHPNVNVNVHIASETPRFSKNGGEGGLVLSKQLFRGEPAAFNFNFVFVGESILSS